MKNNEEIKKILEEELNAWRKLSCKPNVEENIDDIIGIVKYEDHGDEFLLVITNDGCCYEYGYYLNLKCIYTDYLREPTLEIAGKRKYDCEDGIIEADEFKVTVTKNGIIRRWEDNNIRCKLCRRDDWGINIYSISLKQFGYKG